MKPNGRERLLKRRLISRDLRNGAATRALSPRRIIGLFAGRLTPSLIATMRSCCCSPHRARPRALGFGTLPLALPGAVSQNSILAATHSVEFAQRWGRRVRNDIAPDAPLLGIELAADSQASDRWALTSGGEYYGVGAGVGISGFRADLGLGDDFSAIVRMPGARRCGRSAGTGIWTTLRRA